MNVFAKELTDKKDLEMKYLVLKMMDSIDINYLMEKWSRFKKLGKEEYYSDVLVEKIAVDLVNAILRNK